MKICLLTGFQPFLDHPINPTEEIVHRLNQKKIGNYHIEGRILPVVFEEAGEEMGGLLDQVQPDCVISIGLAAGRTKVTPERVAINCRDGAPDNTGKSYENDLIEKSGDVAYFSTLPLKKLVKSMKANNLPAEISNTAGTYVCNNVMYKVLYELRKAEKEIPAGFIHIPASHELALHQPKYPSWSTEDLVKAIKLCIQAV
jgi:pyroglutamyl-peptidase